MRRPPRVAPRRLVEAGSGHGPALPVWAGGPQTGADGVSPLTATRALAAAITSDSRVRPMTDQTDTTTGIGNGVVIAHASTTAGAVALAAFAGLDAMTALAAFLAAFASVFVGDVWVQYRDGGTTTTTRRGAGAPADD